MFARRLLFAALSLALAGCPALEIPTPDGGDVPDAGVAPDGGDIPDGGEPLDGGEPVDDGGTPDAGDVVLDGGITDWRNVRGAPWQVRVVGEYAGAAPFALGPQTFALVRGCDAGTCDYEVRAQSTGDVVATRPGLRSLFSSAVSRGGTHASLFSLGAESSCTTTDGRTLSLWTTSWHLVDLATGASSATLPNFVTTEFLDSAFLSAGGHARLVPIDAQRCDYDPLLLRATAAPHGPSPVEPRLDASAWIERELDDGRLVVSKMVSGLEHIVVLDPAAPATDVLVNDDSTSVRVSAGFVHSTTRAPARVLNTYDLAQRRLVRTDLDWQARDHLEQGASGRFIAFCTAVRAPDGDCEVHDGMGVRAPMPFQVQVVSSRLQLAIAGRAGFAVSVRDGKVWRRSLTDGSEQQVLDRPAVLRTVADGRAVLAIDGPGEAAFAIESARVVAFPGRYRGVVDAAAVGGAADLRQAMTVLVVTTNASGGAAWLNAWHVPTGRVRFLTESLNFNPPFQAPLTAADACNAPGFARPAGAPWESAAVETRLLHFTEFVAQAQPKVRLFVLPVDLGAPPRLIAEVEPDACGTPLSSADATRVWLPVPMPTGGVRGVIATP